MNCDGCLPITVNGQKMLWEKLDVIEYLEKYGVVDDFSTRGGFGIYLIRYPNLMGTLPLTRLFLNPQTRWIIMLINGPTEWFDDIQDGITAYLKATGEVF